MEILKEGTTEILISLVISSFTLSLLPLEIHKNMKKRVETTRLSKFFIIAGLLMTSGFALPLVFKLNNIFLISFLSALISAGMSLFIISCLLLLFEIR
jgi:hypothetical protein